MPSNELLAAAPAQGRADRIVLTAASVRFSAGFSDSAAVPPLVVLGEITFPARASIDRSRGMTFLTLAVAMPLLH